MKTLITLLTLLSFSVLASPYGQGMTGATGATGMTGAQGIQGTNGSSDYVGAASATLAAAGLQFDVNTTKIQFGVSAGMYRGREGDKSFGSAVGVAKGFKVGKNNVLVNGAYSRSRGNAYGASVSATMAF